MRSELRLAVAAAALLLVAAAPEAAVTLPFAPPTGVPIRYDCTTVRNLGGRPLTMVAGMTRTGEDLKPISRGRKFFFPCRAPKQWK